MTISEAYLTPLAECFTPDVARRIVDCRPNKRIEKRLEYLREKANEGTLTEEEHAEYAEFVETLDFVGLLKAQARRMLESRT